MLFSFTSTQYHIIMLLSFTSTSVKSKNKGLTEALCWSLVLTISPYKDGVYLICGITLDITLVVYISFVGGNVALPANILDKCTRSVELI